MKAHPTLRVALWTVVAASLSAACAHRLGSSPETTGSGPVLRVETRGGFLAPTATLTRIPQFSLYADGVIIVPGAQIAIYPGPAASSVFSMKVDREGLARILQAAHRAGLDGPNRTFGLTTVADAGTTTFTFAVDGARHVISAYALGVEPDPSMPEPERKARAALQGLQTKLETLRSWLPQGSLSADRPFRSTAIAVIVSTQPGDTSLHQQEIVWPLARSITELSEPVAGDRTASCFTVHGQDLEQLRPLVERANELTPWKSAGTTYWLRFRPLLPDESDCPQA